MCQNASDALVLHNSSSPLAQNYFKRTCTVCYKPCLS